MAGFPGNPRKLGSAGIPPGPPPPFVTETTNTGTDNFYILGVTLAEDINPQGASNPPVNITESTNTGTDNFYILGFVMAESGSPGSSSGMFKATAMTNNGSDTFYILGIVFSEH